MPWRRRLLLAAGLAALALPVSFSLFTGQLLEGHDAIEYFPRLIEFHQNIKAGILLPRWAPDLSFGLGQPLFLFNPPLIYYAGEFWHILGFSFVTSMNLACAAMVFASAAAMFLLGRLYFGTLGGWLAAAALLYAPYFSVDLYVRSAMAEFASFPFLALSLWGFGAYARNADRRALLAGSAAYAAVIFCHLPAALLFSPLLAAFLVFTGSRRWRVLIPQMRAMLLGLALAAAVWLPAMLLRGNIQVERLLEGTLRYSNHFVYLPQLFSWSWGYGLSVPGPGDHMSFSLGWTHLLLAAIACVLARQFRRWMLFFAAAAMLLCALMLTPAIWLWDRVPLLQYVQFPWRLLEPAALCVALLIAPLGRVLEKFPRFRTAGFAAALALLILPNLTHLHPRASQPIDATLWTPPMIAERGIVVTASGEYAPRWIKVPPRSETRLATVLEGAAQIWPSERTPVSWTAAVVASRPSRVRMAMAYFPGWRVAIDNTTSEARPDPATGQISFKVTPGEHRVEVSWQRTPILWLGDGISTAAGLIFLALLFRSRAGCVRLGPGRAREEAPSRSYCLL